MTKRAALLVAAVGSTCCLTPGCAPTRRPIGTEAAPALGSERRVTVDRGVLMGTRGPHGATAFLGVPYAEPPTGEWRWKPPRPAESWSGARAAAKLGPACPQIDRWEKIRPLVVTSLGGDPSAVPPLGPPRLGPTSEDCLSLNVWTPDLGGATKRPVMVWIHGGSFAEGSGGEDAAALAPLGVVVVTINYRLGMLGFLAHPALTSESLHHASGNYGLLDQIEALRWVRRNIAAFGGDANRVTIFGHSAGADSVLQLLASPLARGLFQRAVAQSSSLGESLPLAEAERQGVDVANRLGAPAADPLSALRGESVERLLSTAPGGFEPTTDGWLLPEPVPKVFAAGRTDGVPLLVGATANEWAIFAMHSPPANDQQTYRELLRKAGDSRVDRLLASYPASRNEDVPAAAIRYLTDRDFVCPARWVAAERRDRTWFYRVSAPPAAGPAAARYGAVHGSEVRLLFNQVMGIPLGDTGVRVGDAMRRYWTQFAATGDPNVAGLPNWPLYERAKPRHLELGDPIRALAGLGNAGCDVFDETQSAQ